MKKRVIINVKSLIKEQDLNECTLIFDIPNGIGLPDIVGLRYWDKATTQKYVQKD